MKLRHRFVQFAVVGFVALGVAGTAAAASRKETNTILGAGLGALAGAVITQGDPLVTLGGAAAGGLLGNVLTENRHGRSVRGYENRRGVRHVNRRPVYVERQSSWHRGRDHHRR